MAAAVSGLESGYRPGEGEGLCPQSLPAWLQTQGTRKSSPATEEQWGKGDGDNFHSPHLPIAWLDRQTDK